MTNTNRIIPTIINIASYKRFTPKIINNPIPPYQMFDDLRINLILLILNIIALGNFAYPPRK